MTTCEFQVVGQGSRRNGTQGQEYGNEAGANGAAASWNAAALRRFSMRGNDQSNDAPIPIVQQLGQPYRCG